MRRYTNPTLTVLTGGAAHLPSVITSEYSRGLGSLHRVYAPYFRIPLADLLTRQISYQNQWFLLIRTGREADDPSFTDDVIGNPAFRRWIGLHHATSIFSPCPSIQL